MPLEDPQRAWVTGVSGPGFFSTFPHTVTSLMYGRRLPTSTENRMMQKVEQPILNIGDDGENITSAVSLLHAWPLPEAPKPLAPSF